MFNIVHWLSLELIRLVVSLIELTYSRPYKSPISRSHPPKILTKLVEKHRAQQSGDSCLWRVDVSHIFRLNPFGNCRNWIAEGRFPVRIDALVVFVDRGQLSNYNCLIRQLVAKRDFLIESFYRSVVPRSSLWSSGMPFGLGEGASSRKTENNKQKRRALKRSPFFNRKKSAVTADAVQINLKWIPKIWKDESQIATSSGRPNELFLAKFRQTMTRGNVLGTAWVWWKLNFQNSKRFVVKTFFS